MTDNKSIEEVRETVAVGVAGAQADRREADKQLPNSKRPDLMSADVQPPRLVQAIVLFQAQVRVKKFLRTFGSNAYAEFPDLAPLPPQMVLGLYLVRRMLKPGYVNLKKEALGVAAIFTEKENLSMAMIGDALMRYSRCLNFDNPAVRLLEEKSHFIKVDAIETLEHKFLLRTMEMHRNAATESVTLYMRRAIDTVVKRFDIPVYDLEECCGKYERILANRLAELQTEYSEKLRLAPNSYSIREIKKEADFLLSGSVNDLADFANKTQRAIKQRKQFLESELVSRWDFPLHGVLGPFEYALRQYVSELGANHPQVVNFEAEVANLYRRYEKKFTEESQSIIDELERLEKGKAAAPQVKSVLQHFDQQMQLRLGEAKENILYWGNLFGFEKSQVQDYTGRLCSPRTKNKIYIDAIKRLIGEVRLSKSEGIEESRDQKAIARYHFVRGYLHDLMDIIQDEWDEVDAFREEIPDQRHEQVIGTADDDGPTGMLSPNVGSLSAMDPEMMKQNINLPTGFSSIELFPHDPEAARGDNFTRKLDDFGHKTKMTGADPSSLVEKPDFTSTLNIMTELENEEALKTGKSYSQMQMEAGQQLGSFETLKSALPLDAAQVAEDITHIDAGSKKAIEAQTTNLALQEGQAAEGNNERILAQLTLHDLAMDDVQRFSEPVLATKFSRALAAACDIDPSRIRVLGFRPGSIKIIFEILPSTDSLADDRRAKVQHALLVQESEKKRKPMPEDDTELKVQGPPSGTCYNSLLDTVSRQHSSFRRDPNVEPFVSMTRLTLEQLDEDGWDKPEGKLDILHQDKEGEDRTRQDSLTVAKVVPPELAERDPESKQIFGVPPPKQFPLDLGEGQMRPTTSYAQAPKSRIYDKAGGMWTKVEGALRPPSYKTYPAPSCDEIDELLLDKVVFFRPTTAPAANPSTATPMPYAKINPEREDVNFDDLGMDREYRTPYPKPKNYDLYDEIHEPGNRGVVKKFNPFASFAVTRFPANAPKQVRDARQWGTIAQMQLRNTDDICAAWIPGYDPNTFKMIGANKNKTRPGSTSGGDQQIATSPDSRNNRPLDYIPPGTPPLAPGMEVDSLEPTARDPRYGAPRQIGGEAETPPRPRGKDGELLPDPEEEEQYQEIVKLLSSVPPGEDGTLPIPQPAAQEGGAEVAMHLEAGDSVLFPTSGVEQQPEGTQLQPAPDAVGDGTSSDSALLQLPADLTPEEQARLADAKAVVLAETNITNEMEIAEIVALAEVELNLAPLVGENADETTLHQFILEADAMMDSNSAEAIEMLADASTQAEKLEELDEEQQEKERQAAVQAARRNWKLAANAVRRYSKSKNIVQAMHGKTTTTGSSSFKDHPQSRPQEPKTTDIVSKIMADEEADEELKAAALKIQAAQRGKADRRKVEALKAGQQEGAEGLSPAGGDAGEQQTAGEGVIVIDEEDEELKQAAIRIQAVQRGKQDRRRLQKLEEEKKVVVSDTELLELMNDENADEELKAAAVKIQAIQRGKADRRKVQEKISAQKEGTAILEDPAAATVTAAPKAEEHQDGHLDEQQVEPRSSTTGVSFEKDEETMIELDLVEDEELKQAAIKIQAMQRGKADRRKVAEKKDTKEKDIVEPLSPATLARPVTLDEATVAELAMDEDEELRAAAVKIQAVQRGKQQRRKMSDSAGAATPAVVTTTIDEATVDAIVADEEADEELKAAAVRIQAVQRGKQDRRKMEEKKAAKEAGRFSPGATGAQQEVEGPPTAEAGAEDLLTQQELEEDKELEQAAIKIQAVQRGKQERKKRTAAAGDASPIVATPVVDRATIDAIAADEEEDEELRLAAIKIQAVQRGKQDRKKMAEKHQGGIAVAAEGEAAATAASPPAVEHQDAAAAQEENKVDIDENDEELKAAAVKIQAVQRGKMQRRKMSGGVEGGDGTSPSAAAASPEEEPTPLTQEEAVSAILADEEADEELKAAAVKIQAVQRGKLERRKLSEKSTSSANQARVGESTQEQASIPQQKIVIASATAGSSISVELDGAAIAELLGDETAEEELKAAAVKIQAVQRGKLERRKMQEKKMKSVEGRGDGLLVEQAGVDEGGQDEPSSTAGPGAPPDQASTGAQQGEEPPIDIIEDEELLAAAVKIQAAQRGKKDRKKVEEKKQEKEQAASAAIISPAVAPVTIEIEVDSEEERRLSKQFAEMKQRVKQQLQGFSQEEEEEQEEVQKYVSDLIYVTESEALGAAAGAESAAPVDGVEQGAPASGGVAVPTADELQALKETTGPAADSCADPGVEQVEAILEAAVEAVPAEQSVVVPQVQASAPAPDGAEDMQKGSENAIEGAEGEVSAEQVASVSAEQVAATAATVAGEGAATEPPIDGAVVVEDGTTAVAVEAAETEDVVKETVPTQDGEVAADLQEAQPQVIVEESQQEDKAKGVVAIPPSEVVVLPELQDAATSGELQASAVAAVPSAGAQSPDRSTSNEQSGSATSGPSLLKSAKALWMAVTVKRVVAHSRRASKAKKAEAANGAASPPAEDAGSTAAAVGKVVDSVEAADQPVGAATTTSAVEQAAGVAEDGSAAVPADAAAPGEGVDAGAALDAEPGSIGQPPADGVEAPEGATAASADHVAATTTPGAGEGDESAKVPSDSEQKASVPTGEASADASAATPAAVEEGTLPTEGGEQLPAAEKPQGTAAEGDEPPLPPPAEFAEQLNLLREAEDLLAEVAADDAEVPTIVPTGVSTADVVATEDVVLAEGAAPADNATNTPAAGEQATRETKLSEEGAKVLDPTSSLQISDQPDNLVPPEGGAEQQAASGAGDPASAIVSRGEPIDAQAAAAKEKAEAAAKAKTAEQEQALPIEEVAVAVEPVAVDPSVEKGKAEDETKPSVVQFDQQEVDPEVEHQPASTSVKKDEKKKRSSTASASSSRQQSPGAASSVVSEDAGLKLDLDTHRTVDTAASTRPQTRQKDLRFREGDDSTFVYSPKHKDATKRPRSGGSAADRSPSSGESRSPRSRSPPLADMTNRAGLTSWVGMLSGLGGSGLRGPIARADDAVGREIPAHPPGMVQGKKTKSFIEDDLTPDQERLRNLVSPAYVRHVLRSKVIGIGPPYNANFGAGGRKIEPRGKSAEAGDWTWAKTQNVKQDTRDWSRSYQHVRTAFDNVGGRGKLPRLKLGPPPQLQPVQTTPTAASVAAKRRANARKAQGVPVGPPGRAFRKTAGAKEPIPVGKTEPDPIGGMHPGIVKAGTSTKSSPSSAGKKGKSSAAEEGRGGSSPGGGIGASSPGGSSPGEKKKKQKANMDSLDTKESGAAEDGTTTAAGGARKGKGVSASPGGTAAEEIDRSPGGREGQELPDGAGGAAAEIEPDGVDGVAIPTGETGGAMITTEDGRVIPASDDQIVLSDGTIITQDDSTKQEAFSASSAEEPGEQLVHQALMEVVENLSGGTAAFSIQDDLWSEQEVVLPPRDDVDPEEEDSQMGDLEEELVQRIVAQLLHGGFGSGEESGSGVTSVATAIGIAAAPHDAEAPGQEVETAAVGEREASNYESATAAATGTAIIATEDGVHVQQPAIEEAVPNDEEAAAPVDHRISVNTEGEAEVAAALPLDEGAPTEVLSQDLQVAESSAPAQPPAETTVDQPQSPAQGLRAATQEHLDVDEDATAVAAAANQEVADSTLQQILEAENSVTKDFEDATVSQIVLEQGVADQILERAVAENNEDAAVGRSDREG